MLVTKEENSVDIPCPAHHGLHSATLHCWPHVYAGIWQCSKSGFNGLCDHTDIEIEDATDDHYDPRAMYVCAACKKELEGDPAEGGYCA